MRSSHGAIQPPPDSKKPMRTFGKRSHTPPQMTLRATSIISIVCEIIDIIVNKPIDQKVVELSSSQRYSLVENSMYHAVFLLKAYNKMTFSYNQVKEHPKLFLAMTGLTHAEFEQLLPHFQGALDQYVQDNYIDRDKRQRQYGGGKPESTLITIEDKLLFILYYVKVYPLQEILAFEFDMVQSTANEWIHILCGV